MDNNKLNNRPNMSMHSQPNRFNNSDKTTPNKLQNLGNKNRSIPPISGSSFSNENQEIESTETQENVEEVNTTPNFITSLTNKINNESQMDEAAKMVIGSKWKKIKLIIIISTIVFALLFLIIFGSLISIADNTDMGESTSTYVSNEMSDDDLIDQLKYYGYCNNENDCKSKGVYKFFEKLKDTYSEYSKECGSSVKNDEPCGVRINTALIIETINYYQNSGDSFNSNNTEVTEDDVTNSGFSIKNIFSGIVNRFKEQKEINDMLDQVEDLALAQTEFVKNNCGQEFYQISFNKYVSYLKYGTSSTHPNYSGKAVTTDNCSGPSNDYIGTSYSDGEQNSSVPTTGTQGEQIVQYALQFVGNPYVYGGTSLTEGTDCSGFTMRVFENFGIALPHSSTAQFSASGAKVISTSLNDMSNALPGDLLVWNGHVAIYIGNNQMVHAQSKNTGIVVSKISSGHTFLGIVRYWSET